VSCVLRWSLILSLHTVNTLDNGNGGGGGVGQRTLRQFQFSDDVKRRLTRPLDEWQACESFDVTGLRDALRFLGWSDVMFVPSASLSLLRVWEQDEVHGKHIAAFGSPGIGRSALAQLCVVRSLLLGEPVFLHYSGANVLLEYDEEAGGVWRTSSDSVDAATMRAQPHGNFVMVYDSPIGFDRTFGSAQWWKRAMVLASGDIDSLKSHLHMHFLDQPTIDELVAFGKIDGIARDVVHERVRRFGASFRVVASDDRDLEVITQAGVRALIQLGVRGLETIVSTPEVVQRILKETKVDGWSVFSFGSEEFANTVLAKIAEEQPRELLALANTIDRHGSLRGQVFENRMHDAFTRATSITLKTRKQNDDDGERTRQMQRNATVRFAVRLGGTQQLPVTLHTNTYYQLIEKYNASYDAFFIDDDGTVWLIQYTVAKEHAVGVQGLKAALELINERSVVDANNEPLTVVRNRKPQLVFVVPPVLFEQFRLPQRLTPNDAANPIDTQHVWCIDQVDTKPVWQ
jgi:hypothetical protein